MGKLVRDTLGDIIEQRDGTEHVDVLDDAGFDAALRAKLCEEALEVQNAANAQDLIEELADVYEVLAAMLEFHDLNWQHVKDAAATKHADRGGFERRIWWHGPC